MSLETLQPAGTLGSLRPGPGAPTLRSNRPVEVCFLIDDLATGGTETQLLRLIEGLDRRVVQPHLCLLNGTGAESAALEPSCCPVVRLGVTSLRTLRAAAAANRLRRYLRRARIDVLQTFFADSTVFGGAVGKVAGVKRVVRTRRDLVFWTTRSHRLIWRRVDRALRWIACDRVITNSEACAESVVADEGVSRECIAVIPNGLALERFAAVPTWKRFGARGAKPNIGVVAMLRAEKGIDLFVRSIGELNRRGRNVAAIVAGEGGLRESLVRQSEAMGLQGAISFAGRTDDVPAFLGKVDVAVSPSYTEGFPNAIIEYMAAGRPIVATSVGGTRELVTHGFDGLLVPPNDASALADGVERLLDDPVLAEKLAAAARVTARAYAMQQMIERHQDFYRRLAFGDAASAPR